MYHNHVDKIEDIMVKWLQHSTRKKTIEVWLNALYVVQDS